MCGGVRASQTESQRKLMMMDVNRSEVVAEITAEFESYEEALMANDI